MAARRARIWQKRWHVQRRRRQQLTNRLKMSQSYFKLNLFCLVSAVLATAAAYPTAAAEAETRPGLAVLNIELVGDTGGPQFAAEHDARLKMESDRLRQELRDSGLYRVLDLTPALPLIS